MKKVISNQSKAVRIFKKVAVTVTASLIFVLSPAVTQANTTSAIHLKSPVASTSSAIHLKSQVEQQVNTGGINESLIKHNLTEEKDIRWRYKANAIQLESLNRYTNTLKLEYLRYWMSTPASERKADDFYHSFYRTHSYMYHIIEEDGFNLQARDIVYSDKPASYTANLLFVKQTNLALNKMEYFKDLLRFIESNGDHKYLSLFNNYELANKTTRY
ncbi:hypothetical protein CN918_28395 [Priestia megaterium]|nr:hypothetical protein CN918_28395 [Priestia megaterium]